MRLSKVSSRRKSKRMNVMKVAVLVVGIAIIAIVLFNMNAQSETDAAGKECEQMCRHVSSAGVDLESGPCLASPMTNYHNWVCDVVHDPRTNVDNQPENQCNAYLNNQAKHFVEVDTNCNLVRAI